MKKSTTAESNGETRFLGSLSTTSLRNLLSKSMSAKKKSNSKFSKSSDPENTPPVHPNISSFADPPLSPSLPKLSPSKSSSAAAISDSHHRTYPPLVGEVDGSDDRDEASAVLDPAVKVVVRIKPVINDEKGGDVSVRKVSPDSLFVGDRKFTFDSVLDSKSNQEDVFQLVGIPLVKTALAGYNATILSYGQTGSGKTYTMWGPPSAMVEDPLPNSCQGIVPRIFHMLFSEMEREREISQDKQINYQCRCSFLEIYNEQIGDLLDPMQRNLEIRDDPKNGLYVENLTEEYVSSYEDVTQILIKGLSSRKVGATSLNSKSSRSHVIFTFVIESWCKGASSNGFSSSKISRISLVDLAGLERNKLDDGGRQFVRENKNVKKSLCQLGQLVSNLAKGSQMGRVKVLPYRGSCLTHLLQESLGGNAKLTVVCSISSDYRNDGETLRTLRFGQRIKSIKNDPVINEISEDDVNDLSDQIRQLKEELIREKSDVCNSVGSKNGYFRGRNARESLNHLRVSLNRSLIFAHADNQSDNEVNFDENDVRELHQQLNKLHSSSEDNLRDSSENKDSSHFTSVEESLESDSMSEDEANGLDDIENEAIIFAEEKNNFASENMSTCASECDTRKSISVSVSLCHHSPVLQEPILSESPKIARTRKSIAGSSIFSASQNHVLESSNFKSDALHSVKQNENIRSSLRSSKMFQGPTECLAASLQRGLQIIDYHQQNPASHRSSVAFSFEHLALKPCPEIDEPGASVRKLAKETPVVVGPPASLLCASCQRKMNDGSNDVEDSLKTWIVAVDETGKSNKLKDEVAKEAGNNLEELGKREKELENVCMEQAAKIEQLTKLVEQYKNGREYSIMAQSRQEGNDFCLEGLRNYLIPFEGSKNEGQHPLEDQNKFLSEIVEEKYEIKEVQEVLDDGNANFDVKEKEELLREIQSLRTKLQSYTDAPGNRSTEKLRSSLLARSIHLRKSIDTRHYSEEELEKERQRWTEMESDWISLTDDLRIDLESHRQHAEKVEMELLLEKKCTEELDDALHRSVLGHARMVEHYSDLQEKYNDLVGKHRAIMEGIAEVKRAAAKAGTKGGTRFAKSLAAELSALRVEREREREFLKKENKNLKNQLRDTAEAVHAAGELLVRLREAEQAASAAEENFANAQQENEKLKKQIEKLKRKHKMEMITMKQYLAESRLPESALRPLYREDSDAAQNAITMEDDDQAWRAEFGAIYQQHY